MNTLDDLICFQVYRLHHAFGRYYQAAFGDTGFTYPKYVVLKALEEIGPASLGELSAQVGVETNTLSPLLKRMAEFGLLTRARDKNDERRVVLELLPYGRDVLAEADRVAEAGFAELGIKEDDITRTVASLAKLRTAIETADPPKMTRPDPPGSDSA